MKTILIAKNLMIGDWVLAYESLHGHLHKTAIMIASLSRGLTLQDISGKYANYDAIEPIPLTAEILEKNGWVFMEGQDYSTFPVPSKWTYQFAPFALRVNGETYNVANTFTIKYVHELQHALRLCGLDKLADNFKIR